MDLEHIVHSNLVASMKKRVVFPPVISITALSLGLTSLGVATFVVRRTEQILDKAATEYSTLRRDNQSLQKLIRKSRAMVETALQLVRSSRNLENFATDLRPPFVFNQHLELSPEENHSLRSFYTGTSSTAEARGGNFCQVTQMGRISSKVNAVLSGSGTFIAPGWILTAYHVITPNVDVLFQGRLGQMVETINGEVYSTLQGIDVAAVSPRYDLALLRVSREATGISTLCLSRAHDFDPEETVPSVAYQGLSLLLADPDTEEFTVTTSSIPAASATNEVSYSLLTDTFNYKFGVVKQGPPIEPGNSGSPVYDQHGCVAGIVVSQNPRDHHNWYFTPWVREFITLVLEEASSQQ